MLSLLAMLVLKQSSSTTVLHGQACGITKATLQLRTTAWH